MALASPPLGHRAARPPLLRGWVHLGAAGPALAAGVVLVVLAPDAPTRMATTVYGLALVSLFAVSAAYHRWAPGTRAKALLRRLDHGTIYAFIAGTFTPLAVALLDGPLRTAALAVVWAGAALGIALSVTWIDAPRWLAAATYLALGSVGAAVIPATFGGGILAGALMVLGGLLYALGAITYATRRPDPWPFTFGFHEIFHVAVTVAAIAQYAAVAIVVV